jgi:hypothetical protein
MEMPHDGVVRSFTLLHEAPTGFEGQEPLLIALVRLSNGVQVLGQIVDAPDGVRIGEPVRVVFRRIRVEGEAGQIHYGFKFAPVREENR